MLLFVVAVDQSLYSWKASSKGWVFVKYPNYKVEINNGVQFIFSITYMEMSQEISENVSVNSEMSQEIYVELIIPLKKPYFNIVQRCYLISCLEYIGQSLVKINKNLHLISLKNGT